MYKHLSLGLDSSCPKSHPPWGSAHPKVLCAQRGALCWCPQALRSCVLTAEQLCAAVSPPEVTDLKGN